MFEDDYCEQCNWYEETLDAPCFTCMKPSNEKCPYEEERDK